MGGMSGLAGRTHGSRVKRHPNIGVSLVVGELLACFVLGSAWYAVRVR